MKRSIIAALVILAFTAVNRAAAQGQDQFVWGLSGGAMIPSGLGADNHKTGPVGAVMLGIGSVDSPFGVRFDASYGSLGAKTGPRTLGLGSAKVFNFNANAIFTLLGQEKKLYFVGGAGSYNYNPEGRVSTKDLALNAGLGFWVPAADAFVEARWFNLVRALPDPVTGLRGKRALRIYPISLGFLF
jgi:hypothetical protein